MPWQILESRTRLFEFSTTYKAPLGINPVFGRNTLCGSVSCAESTRVDTGRAAVHPLPYTPLILLGYRRKPLTLEFIRIAVLEPAWSGRGMLYTIELVSGIFLCPPEMLAAFAGRGCL